MKGLILSLVRVIIAIMLGLSERIGIKGGYYKYPLMWLKHFLEGSGQPLEVPEQLVLEALKGFGGTDVREPSDWEKSQYPGLRGVLEVYHSTSYEGGGFLGRPPLFYLIGCFKALWYEDNSLVIEDLYDWGKEPSSGQYYCSELPVDLPWWVHKLLNVLLGKEYYPMEGWPMGQPGVSNKLWHDMQELGLAKPFLSTYNGKVDLEEMGFQLQEVPLQYSGGFKTEYPHAPLDKAEWINKVLNARRTEILPGDEDEGWGDIESPQFTGDWGDSGVRIWHNSSYKLLCQCTWHWFDQNLLPLGGIWKEIRNGY